MKKVLFLPFIIGLLAVIVFASRLKESPQKTLTKISPLKTHFSIEKPPTESLQGKISTYSGSVKWQSRVATEPGILTQPVPIVQGGDIQTLEKSSIEVDFPNACSFTLFEKTSLSLIQTLPLNFVFEQKSGKASYQKLGSIPLSVRSLHLLIQIEGKTVIFLDEKLTQVTVTVASDKAYAAYNNVDNQSAMLQLSQGKKLIFNDKTRQAYETE